jgi:hypothetical protein
MPAKSGQYYRTEQEIAKLMRGSGLPMGFTDPFTKDYAAVKSDVAGTDESLEQVISDIDSLDGRVLNAESEISSLNSDVDSLNTSVLNLALQAADFEDRLVIVEDDLTDLTTDFNLHTADESAHGATGDIVGTDDYCTPTVGGTVLLASALSPNANSTLVITTTPTAPGAVYLQAEAVTWVATINELKTDFNALILEFNQLVSKVNSIISTQETAKQRDT